MTSLIVNEKYPPGRRIDHPDFSDVHKTTFAKGVIMDFKRPDDVANPNDPFVVMSMVKVDIGGDEWLPLFFHPKPLFWDDPAPLATAYNEEGYFEKAWMSFRCGDEVAVMLKSGVPVAVLGFADGVPRVGEDKVKVEADNRTQYYSMTRGDCQEDSKGPDGLELGLANEVEPFDEVAEPEDLENYNSIRRATVWIRTIGGG